jgi:hypothetical protein
LKKIILLIILLLVLPDVLAITNLQWSVESIKFYVNDVRLSGIDSRDSITVLPNDNLKIKFVIKNFNTTNALTILSSKAVIKNIKDGDDMEEDDTQFTISTDDTNTITYSFNIPPDTEDDSYDMRLDIRANLPGTAIEELFSDKWTVEVATRAVTNNFQTNITSLLIRVNDMCVNLNLSSRLQECINKAELEGKLESSKDMYTSCVSEKNACNSQLSQCPVNNAQCQANLDASKRELIDKESKFTELTNSINSCKNDIQTAKNDATTKMIFGVLAGIAGILAYQWYQKRSGTPMSGIRSETWQR